jgi:hypothetical protein
MDPASLQSSWIFSERRPRFLVSPYVLRFKKCSDGN